MRFLFVKLLPMVVALFGVMNHVVAQEITIVSGKVLNVPDGGGKPRPFSSSETVYIFAFNTIAAANDAMNMLGTGSNLFMSDAQVKAGPDGYYEISVAENGALVFYLGTSMKKELREVNYKDVINVNITGSIELGEVEVVGTFTKPIPKPVAGKIIGGKLIVDNAVTIPGEYGAPNRRLIVQPYVIDCTTEEVVKYIDPVVLDGGEYDLTQVRRMAFDRANDALKDFVNPRKQLGEERFNVDVKDSVPVPDPRRTYSVLAKVVIADYTHETYQDEWKLTTCKIKRPMQFLEYSFRDYELDPNKYKETPRREKRNTAGNISLTFLVNKAELDPDDPNNEAQMMKLQNDLMQIINGEGTTLKEFKIMGVSSPEGGYQRNLALSKMRTAFALKQITSMIPAAKWARVYKHPTEARVATWDEVADLLEKDTLLAEAAQVREITAQYKSQDAQYAAIRKLPFYETAIMNTFPRLRTVHYGYKYDIFRDLSPEEIVKRYYQDGKRQFTRYEYWHLFQQIKDPKEAEKLYRKAYKETMTSDGKPWLLAANNLAVALLKRDTFDVEILKPLINYKRKVNSINRYDDGLGVEITEINPENVVANQLAMYIRAYNFAGADTLAQMLPNTDKFRMVKAFSSCLRGRYNYHKAKTEKELKQFRETFELMKNSSPINHVVMCMAMRNDGLNKEALKVLETIPVSTKTKYLKLQLFCRMNIKSKNIKDLYYGDLELEHIQTAYKMLDEIIKEDAKYRDIALNDGEFSEEFIEFYNDPEKRKKQWGLFD